MSISIVVSPNRTFDADMSLPFVAPQQCPDSLEVLVSKRSMFPRFPPIVSVIVSLSISLMPCHPNRRYPTVPLSLYELGLG